MVIVLVLTFLLAYLAEMPWIGRAWRAHLLQVLIVGFFAYLAANGRAQEDLRNSFKSGPGLWLLLLVLWCAFEVAFPPTAALGFGSILRPFSYPDLLRVAMCAGAFFAAAYFSRIAEVRVAVYTILVVGAVVALFGIAKSGSSIAGTEVTGIFGNHEQFGSFLMLLMPVALAIGLDRNGDQKVTISAQVIALLLGGALLLARTRSSWIGEFAGIVALAVLIIRNSDLKLTKANKFQVIGPLLVLVIGFAVLVFSGEFSSLLSKRVASFTHGLEDASFNERVHRWQGASRMVYEKPVTGWGLGAFPILQKRWTGTGDSAVWAVQHGTGHSNLAHNFWVQWAAEAGGVGLILYTGAMVAFLICGCRAVSRTPAGSRRMLLIGCIAATVTALGDMMGSPSYSYVGASSLLWMLMGIGVAVCREPKRSGETVRIALPPSPAWVWAVSAASGMAVFGVIFVAGSHQPAARGETVPAAQAAPQPATAPAVKAVPKPTAAPKPVK